MEVIILFIAVYVLLTIGLVVGGIILIKKLTARGKQSSLQRNAVVKRMQQEHNEQHMQQMMQNPYATPGLDPVVDRHHHGIHNGMD